MQNNLQMLRLLVPISREAQHNKQKRKGGVVTIPPPAPSKGGHMVLKHFAYPPLREFIPTIREGRGRKITPKGDMYSTKSTGIANSEIRPQRIDVKNRFS